MNSTPELISVVIPTHNRCQTLMRALDALCRQDFPVERFEVVVVMDGCQDGTRAMLQSYPAPFQMLTIEQEQRGPGAARNHGAAKARGGLLVFLDDDVIPSRGLITAHVEAHRGKTDRVVVGPYLPEIHGKTAYTEMHLRSWWYDKFRSLSHPGHRFSYEDFLAGNCSMSQSLMARVRGFDEAFPCAHEDYELGVRLLKANATFHYAEAASATHEISHSSTRPRLRLRSRLEAQADILIGMRHPELRPFLRLAAFGHPRRRINRWAHFLAFNWPTLGDSIAGMLEILLRVLQRMQLRRRWERLYSGLNAYWYLRGLADSLGEQQALHEFLDDRTPAQTSAQADEDLLIDLGRGIEEALRKVEEHRPAGVRLVLDDAVVGRIAPRPGHEPLRGVHVQHHLGKNLTWHLFTSVIQDRGSVEHMFTPTGQSSPPCESAQI